MAGATSRTGLGTLRLLLICHGATCTKFFPFSAASGSPLAICRTPRDREAGTCQEASETKTCQELLKLVRVHHLSPFWLVGLKFVVSPKTRKTCEIFAQPLFTAPHELFDPYGLAH